MKALKEKIKELEKELSLEKVVAEIRKVLWEKIGQSITDQWQYINTQVVPFDSQGNTAGVTTNQSLGYRI